MPELQDEGGNPIEAAKAEANREFAAAMADDKPEPAAPPKRPERTPEAAPKRRGRPPKAERARTDPKPAAAAPVTHADRVQAVEGVVQLGAGLALLASRATARTVRDEDGKLRREDNPAFKADAIVLASSAAEIAEAVADTAERDARFAAMVDKVAAAGPYGALITVMFGVGAQLARNHRPGARLPGTVDPAELLAEAERQPVAA